MKNTTFAFTVLLGLFVTPTFAQATRWLHSLCAANESPVLSCQLEGSQKMVSLCALPQSPADEKRFHYRFGCPTKIEQNILLGGKSGAH